MTPLSDSSSRAAPGQAPRPLARLSHPGAFVVRLLVGSMLGVTPSGCLLSDPAGFESPTQTTPVIDTSTADPPPTSILRVSSGDQQRINVQFRSEDVGEDVIGVLFLNYAVGGAGTYQAYVQVPASTWDDTDRTIALTWDVPDRTGCNQLTLVVTHLSNVAIPSRIVDAERATTLSWWVDINDSGDSLSDCPDPTQSEIGSAP